MMAGVEVDGKAGDRGMQPRSERQGGVLEPAAVPADELLDVVGQRYAERLDADLGAPPILGAPQPVALLSLGDDRLGPALAQSDAALGMRGPQVGAGPVVQPAVVRAGDRPRLGRPAAIRSERAGPADLRGG